MNEMEQRLTFLETRDTYWKLALKGALAGIRYPPGSDPYHAISNAELDAGMKPLGRGKALALARDYITKACESDRWPDPFNQESALPWHELAKTQMTLAWQYVDPAGGEYWTVRYIEKVGFCKYADGEFVPIPEELVPNILFEEIFRQVPYKKGTVPETAQNLRVFTLKAQGWLFMPLADCDPYPLLTVANGVLDLTDPAKPVLHPFSPKYVSLRKLPVSFLEHCQETPTRDEMFKAYPQVKALETWIQGVLLRDPRNAIIPFIVGPKNSGKGTFLQILDRIFGETAGHEAISQLGDPRYGLYPLITKWVNIDREMTHKMRLDPEGMRVMKDVITHEGKVTVKKLYKDAFEVFLWIWFIAATNQLPSLPENADRAAWFKRVLVIVFGEVMKSNEKFKQALADETDKIFTNLVLGLADYAPLRPDGADVDAWAEEQEALWDYWSSPAVQACIDLFDCTKDPSDTIRVPYAVDRVREWLDTHQFSPPQDRRLTADITRGMRALHGGKECVKGRSGKADRFYFDFRPKDEEDYAGWCEDNGVNPSNVDANTAKPAGPRQGKIEEFL